MLKYVHLERYLSLKYYFVSQLTIPDLLVKVNSLIGTYCVYIFDGCLQNDSVLFNVFYLSIKRNITDIFTK